MATILVLFQSLALVSPTNQALPGVFSNERTDGYAFTADNQPLLIYSCDPLMRKEHVT